MIRLLTYSVIDDAMWDLKRSLFEKRGIWIYAVLAMKKTIRSLGYIPDELLPGYVGRAHILSYSTFWEFSKIQFGTPPEQ